jgi:hypothetical protein
VSFLNPRLETWFLLSTGHFGLMHCGCSELSFFKKGRVCSGRQLSFGQKNYCRRLVKVGVFWFFFSSTS